MFYCDIKIISTSVGGRDVNQCYLKNDRCLKNGNVSMTIYSKKSTDSEKKLKVNKSYKSKKRKKKERGTANQLFVTGECELLFFFYYYLFSERVVKPGLYVY